MNNFGKLYYELGRFEKAVECLKDGLKISKETGDKEAEGTCYDNLGTVCYRMGQFDNQWNIMPKVFR